jgi:hypothetical protein
MMFQSLIVSSFLCSAAAWSASGKKDIVLVFVRPLPKDISQRATTTKKVMHHAVEDHGSST